MIIIKNGEILIQQWNQNVKNTITKTIDLDLNHYYSELVTFDPELTLEGFFDAIYPWFFKLEKDFQSYTHDVKIQEFYDQLKKDATDVAEFSEIEFYYFYSISVHKDLISNTKINSVDAMARFHAIDSDTQMPNYSVAFTDLNNIKHIKVKLRDKYDIWCMDPDLDNFNQVILAKDLIHTYTLHEILSTFLMELTYFGSLDDMKTFEESVINKFDELRDNDTKFEIVPIEHILIENLQKELQEATDDENYEACVRIKAKIDEYMADLNKNKAA